MINLKIGFNTNLESAVTCFRPILQRLKIREENTGTPVLLSSFPHLWPLGNISNWVITILKANLVDSRAKFISRYHEKSKIMECYIILDNIFYTNARVPREMRKLVAVHEFCHFLALMYACISTSEETLQEILKKRLSMVIEDLNNIQVQALYQFVNQLKPLDDFSDFEQTKDEHFRLNCEDLSLSYTDIFKYFLLSRQLFDEFFPKKDRENFFNLLRNENTQEAYNFYFDTAKNIAQKKWLTEKFAINQAINILMNFYLKEL
jgi:hypothetical protein